MKLSLLSILILLSFPKAQTDTRDYDQELGFQNQAIENLKKEIEALEKQIRTQANRERTTTQKITSMGSEISLLNRLISEIKREEKKTRSQIQVVETRITASEKELAELRDRYARRVQHTYTKGSLSDLEKILSSSSWRQTIYRTRYLKIISDIDKNTQARINSLLINIGRQKLDLEAILRKNLALKRERENRVKTLRNRKISREKELVKIRQSRVELANYKQEKEEGLKQIEAEIKRILEDKTRFEREERIRQQQEALRTKTFQALKGDLMWPAEGRIVSKFGRQWNPKLKTATENPGIDVKGKPGSPIRSVLGGVVTTITYIRGYGTTIIIDHGGAFYTVYSHVTNIETHVNSEVQAGDVIAYMGDSGSVNGSKLHFEVWGQGRKLDPEKWLAKR